MIAMPYPEPKLGLAKQWVFAVLHVTPPAFSAPTIPQWRELG
jgi:hypothetical protein